MKNLPRSNSPFFDDAEKSVGDTSDLQASAEDCVMLGTAVLVCKINGHSVVVPGHRLTEKGGVVKLGV